MLKGVCKQLIEVTDTGNEYFEKAFFFVRPGFSDVERELLEKQARQMLNYMGLPSQNQLKRLKLKRRLLFFSFLAMGFSLAISLFFLFSAK